MPEEREVLAMAENVRLTAEQRTAMIDDIIRMLKEIEVHTMRINSITNRYRHYPNDSETRAQRSGKTE